MSEAVAPSGLGGSIFRTGALRGPVYDSLLIFGTALVALSAGLAVLGDPRLFYPVLLFDLWFFGYHHAIATFTRLCFDRASARQYRLFLTVLPVAVCAVTAAMALGLGIWSVVTLYLYWQWFHYTRQSWGIGRAYRRKAGIADTGDDWLTKAAYYLPPLWGILYRSWQAPEQFLNFPVKTLPVPGVLVDIVAVAAIACTVVWFARRLRLVLRGEEAPLYTIYSFTHVAIFGLGYIAIRDINAGWLIINIWHNTQYLLFVWLFNTRRFAAGAEPQARFLAWISQPRRWAIYAGVCLAITASFYLLISYLANLAFATMAVTATLILYQAVNFHHYIVDSFIWKLRKAPMQATLGLAQPVGTARPGA
jgi:hypothetical protein